MGDGRRKVRALLYLARRCDLGLVLWDPYVANLGGGNSQTLVNLKDTLLYSLELNGCTFMGGETSVCFGEATPPFSKSHFITILYGRNRPVLILGGALMCKIYNGR